MITNLEDYFTKGCGRCARFDTPDCSTRTWQAGLLALRRLCRDVCPSEALKWGHPCYVHAGRNIAIIGALRSDFRLSFIDAALMKDPEGVLVRQGPNTRHPDMIRFTEAGQVARLERVIRSYLEEAMGYAEAGLRPPREQGEIELPEDLVAAMDEDPQLAEAFHRLTPGRQRSYVIALGSAKTAATRVSRIARFRPAILAGKGATER